MVVVEKARELYALGLQYSHSAILKCCMETWMKRYHTPES